MSCFIRYVPERRSLRSLPIVARTLKKKLEEITPSCLRMSPISLALECGGIVTVTTPCPEPWNGWKSSIRNQIAAAASRIAASANRRPNQRRPRFPDLGGRRGLRGGRARFGVDCC